MLRPYSTQVVDSAATDSSICCHHIEVSAQRLQLDAKLFFVDVRVKHVANDISSPSSQCPFVQAFISSDSKVRRTVYPGWSNWSWMQATIMVKVFLTMEVLRRFREVSFAQPIIKSHGSFLLRGSLGSPTLIAPASLVTFVQNMFNCSSPLITLSVSTVIDTTL